MEVDDLCLALTGSVGAVFYGNQDFEGHTSTSAGIV
jgi:hypothetical protein